MAHTQLLSILMKFISCCIFLIAACVNAYFLIFDAATSNHSFFGKLFLVSFGVACTLLMILFFVGAAKTSIGDYCIQLRLLRRLGFAKLKNMSAEEYDDLHRKEFLVEEEIKQRKLER